jgi:hypothetical protein
LEGGSKACGCVEELADYGCVTGERLSRRAAAPERLMVNPTSWNAETPPCLPGGALPILPTTARPQPVWLHSSHTRSDRRFADVHRLCDRARPEALPGRVDPERAFPDDLWESKQERGTRSVLVDPEKD